ncbi:hypothetical protein [Laceyella putida]|uniref:Holin n=1 Tax=Laceyella putida TaxID=110101 RepID=A0ABW2RQ40_9BACL
MEPGGFAKFILLLMEYDKALLPTLSTLIGCWIGIKETKNGSAKQLPIYIGAVACATTIYFFVSYAVTASNPEMSEQVMKQLITIAGGGSK